MTHHCPTCNQRLTTAEARFAGELITTVLTIVPLAVALLIGHVPVWLTVWGCIGLAVAVLSWLAYAARGAASTSVPADNRTIIVTAARRPYDRR